MNSLPKIVVEELLNAPDGWIAKVLGCSTQAVQQWRTRNRFPAKFKRGGRPLLGRDEFIARMRTRLKEVTQ